MTVSDIMCQEMMKQVTKPKGEKATTTTPRKANDLDYLRTVQVAVTGFFWSGPITHFWYAVLEKLYGLIAGVFNIHNPVAGLCVRVALDSAIFSPMVITGYFTVRAFLEGNGLAGAKKKLTSLFKSTLFGAWKFWPIANAFNFWFVPLQFRVLYMNVLSLFWSGYLTYVNSLKVVTAETTKANGPEAKQKRA
jgi:protein Mpv17